VNGYDHHDPILSGHHDMDAAVFVLSCYPLLQRVYLIFTSLFAQKRIFLTVCFWRSSRMPVYGWTCIIPCFPEVMPAVTRLGCCLPGNN